MALPPLFLPAKRKHSSFALGFGGPNFPKASKQIFAGATPKTVLAFAFQPPHSADPPLLGGLRLYSLPFLFFYKDGSHREKAGHILWLDLRSWLYGAI
jgi:hypothetical protein